MTDLDKLGMLQRKLKLLIKDLKSLDRKYNVPFEILGTHTTNNQGIKMSSKIPELIEGTIKITLDGKNNKVQEDVYLEMKKKIDFLSEKYSFDFSILNFNVIKD